MAFIIDPSNATVVEGPQVDHIQAIVYANPDVGEQVAQQMARETNGVAPSGPSGGDIGIG